jgi:hypothetical protein
MRPRANAPRSLHPASSIIAGRGADAGEQRRVFSLVTVCEPLGLEPAAGTPVRHSAGGSE